MARLSSPISGGPTVELLDAHTRELDEGDLRDWARAIGEAAAPAFVSRSYRHPLALVASFVRPVGVDLERLEAHPPGFGASICTPTERRALRERLGDDALVTSLWSSKEALAKAMGDALRYDPRRLDSPLLWDAGEAGPWRAARLTGVPEGHLAWVVWRWR
jgi:4'-phosphopantetheinyl transferase superfamily protein